MELVTAIAESTNPFSEMCLFADLNSCILERCCFVFDNWEADVILEVETELVSTNWFIIEVLWLFVEQTLDHCFCVSIRVHVANFGHVLSFFVLWNGVVPLDSSATSD